jgi:hypothetical protein
VSRTAYSDWYETHNTFGLMEDCNDKLDRCNDCKLCEKLPVNETVETLFVSRLRIERNTDRMSSKLLYIESAARYKHHMQVTMDYCNKGKEVDDGEIEIIPLL